MKHHKLVVFIRCHILPECVADTIDSVRHYSTGDPLIVVTVDRNIEIAQKLQPLYPDVLFFTSPNNCGWGSGLWQLFCEATTWLIEVKRISFDYLANYDYDLIYTKEGADEHFLQYFDSPAVGQVGKMNLGSSHWKRKTRQYLPKFMSIMSREGKTFPRDYPIGSHCAGAFSTLKGTCVQQMHHEGYLRHPFDVIGDTIKLADDPLLSFFVQASGYEMRHCGAEAFVEWHMKENYETIVPRGFYVYHPTKLKPGNAKWSVGAELMCRNHFREHRGQDPILVPPDYPTFGRPTSVKL